MIEQNLYLCLAVSALAAVFTVAGKAVVVYAARCKGIDSTVREDKAITVGTFILFMFLANACIFVAPWFGPIAIYWPTYVASQLMSNMIIIGFVLKQESFDKASQVATLVVATAVLYITINGPRTQEDQDIEHLILDNMLALCWLGFLALIYTLAVLVMFFGKLNGRSAWLVETTLLTISVCSSTLSATASKAASLVGDLDENENNETNKQIARAVLIAVTWLIILIWTITNFQEAAHVRSLARYSLQMTFGSILLNALTGLVVWEDYQSINSWPGYVTALCQLAMGVYLISDLDFFKTSALEQQEFHKKIRSLHTFFKNEDEEQHPERSSRSMKRLQQAQSRHQLTILHKAVKQGIQRGMSDPELGHSSHFQSPLQLSDSGDSNRDLTGNSSRENKKMKSFLQTLSSQRSLRSIIRMTTAVEDTTKTGEDDDDGASTTISRNQPSGPRSSTGSTKPLDWSVRSATDISLDKGIHFPSIVEQEDTTSVMDDSSFCADESEAELSRIQESHSHGDMEHEGRILEV